jgi:hypothetical protein
MQKKLKILLFALVLAATTLLSGYIYLSIKIGCSLTLAEFVRFSSTILWNHTLHAEEKGGSRSLQLAKEAILNPISGGTVIINGQKYSYPLPKFSVCQGGQHYLTFAYSVELQNYFYKELPTAGWEHVDQMGAGHTFKGYGMRMMIVHNFYLGRGISKFGLSIDLP